MESRAKLLGHPIHPMLIPFPLGLLPTAVIFDVVHLVTGDGLFAQVSFWMIFAGVLGGLAAAVFGAIDWLAIPAGTRAKRIGLWHGLGNVVAIGLFAASWALRAGEPEPLSAAALGLSLTGFAIAAVTGWLGGELVDRLGVGVDDGANLNAPNSLSGRPATAAAPGATPGAATRG
jgi:uncharacterized membrane protein